MSPAQEGVCYSWGPLRLLSPALMEAAQVAPCHHRNVCSSHPLQKPRRDAVWGSTFPFVLPVLFSTLIRGLTQAVSTAAETNPFSLPWFPWWFQRGVASLVFCPKLIALLVLAVKAPSALSSEEATFLCWAK